MHIELVPVPESQKRVLDNLLEKYNYEFSQYDGSRFDEQGLFHYDWLDSYWRESGRAAYFLRADGGLAGFALINQHPERADAPLDWGVAEFFVAYPYRRLGVGSAAMAQVFARHRGRWQIKYHPRNEISAAFWQRVARRHACGEVLCLPGDEPYADGTPSAVLCFCVS